MLKELSMTKKSYKKLQKKQRIAKFASDLIEEGDSIYIDAGSTTYEMINNLPDNIVVVTNGMMHVNALLENNMTTYLLGGFAKPKTRAIVGRGALDSLKHYRFDKRFIGVNGIHPQLGFTTPDQEEALIRNISITLYREVYLLSNDSKFSEFTFSKIADLNTATIITNSLYFDIKKQISHLTNIEVIIP